MKILYLLFCSLLLVSGIVQGQTTYRYKVVSSCHEGMDYTAISSNAAAPVIYITEGETAIFYFEITGDVCSTATLIRNLVTVGASTAPGVSFSSDGNNSPQLITITFTNASANNHNGYYSLYNAAGSCMALKFNINVVPKPNWRVLEISDICLESDTKVKITGPSTGLYTWKVIPRTSDETSSALARASGGECKGSLLTPTGNDFENTTSITRANLMPTVTTTDLSFVAEYKQATTNCIWREKNDIAIHLQRPYTNYANGVINHVVGSGTIDASTQTATFNNNVTTPAASITSFSSAGFSNINVPSTSNVTVYANKIMMPTNTPGVYPMEFSADYQGCTYKENFQINVTAGGSSNSTLSFENLSRIPSNSTINDNREACRNDEVKYTFSAVNNGTPLFLSARGINNLPVIIPLANYSGTNPRDYTQTGSVTSINNIPSDAIIMNNVAYANINNNQLTIYLKVFEEIKTGPLKVHYSSNYASSSSSASQSLGIINVNSPIIDFTATEDTLCSNDEILFIPNMTGGTFSARLVDLNLSIPAPYNVNDFAITSTLPQVVNNAFSGNRFNPAVLSFGANNEKKGLLLEITYTNSIKYSDGASCPEPNIVKKEIYPIFNNNPVTFILPRVEVASTPTRLPITIGGGNTSWDEYIINDKAIFTPSLDGIVPNNYDRVFSGQWVGDTTINGNTMQQVNSRIVAGDYPINMTANNNGCLINAVGELKAVEKTAFQNLPSQLCLNARVIEFKRPTYAAYSESITPVHSYNSSMGEYSIPYVYQNINYALSRIVVTNITTGAILESIPSTDTRISNLNQSNENISIDFNDYSGQINYNDEIEISAEFHNTTHYFYPTNGYYYTPVMISFLPADYNLEETYIYSSRATQICKFDVDNTATFVNLPREFCASNSVGIEIETNPRFTSGSSTYKLSLIGSNASFTFTSSNILTAAMFEQVLSMDNTNTSRSFRLEYSYRANDDCTAHGYGDINYISNTPAQVYRQGQNPYTPIEVCKTGFPIVLASNQPNIQITHATASSAVINNNGVYSFNPNVSGISIGQNNLNASYEDGYGCIHNSLVTVMVGDIAPTSLYVDNVEILTNSHTICQNIGDLILGASYNGSIISNAGISNNGQFIIDSVVNSNNIFNPSNYISNTTVTVPIEFEYMANDGCVASKTIDFIIKPAPNLSLVSNSISNPQLPSYICPNDGDYRIIALDNGGIPTGTSTFKGKGVYSASNPSDTIASSVEINYSIVKSLERYTTPTRAYDTLWYINTNTHNCKDSIEYIVGLKPLPIINVSGLDSVYCGNDGINTLTVSPSPTDASVLSYALRGVGTINDAIASPSVVAFDPSLAYASGNMVVDFKYIVQDINFCIDTFEQTVNIKPLPQVALSLPQDNKMCINSLPHLMNVTSIGTTNSYTITSNIVRRDIQGLDTTYFIDPSLLNTSFIAGNAYNIEVESISSDNCINRDTHSITINGIPAVELRGMDNQHYLCTNGNQLVVEGIPIGDITNSSFTPSANLTTHVTTGSGSRAFINPDTSLANTTETIAYTYTDANNCTNTVTKEITFLPPPEIQITSIPVSACQVYNDSTPIRATTIPTANTNLQISGQGIVSRDSASIRLWYFKAFATQVGPQTITFTASQTTGSTTCRNTIQREIEVNPLPDINIVGIREYEVFCNTDSIISLSAPGNNVDTVVFSGIGVESIDSLTARYIPHPRIPGQYIIYGYDTLRSYVVNPMHTNPDSVRQYLTLTTRSAAGCTNSKTITYDVYIAPETYFEAPLLGFTTQNNSNILEICESHESIVFSGYPGNGQFTRNASSTTSANMLGPVYTANPDYVNTPINGSVQYDTIYYNVTTGNICFTGDTLVIKVNPIPRPTLTLGNFSNTLDTIHVCKKDDSLVIHTTPSLNDPTNTTGVLRGNGTRNGYFHPNEVPLGHQILKYEYTDITTGCEYYDELVVRISSTPALSLEADPTCQSTDIEFRVTVDSVEISIDTITGIVWDFGDNNTITTVDASTVSNNITPVNQIHTYTTSGVYQASLTIINNDNCQATDTLRVLVSPKYTIGGRFNPAYHIEDFEGTPIDWFDEQKGSREPSTLWELTDLSSAERIPLTSNNGRKVWATIDTIPYRINSGGWVYSPCFDIDEMKRPMISLDYFIDTDPSGKDGAVIEFYNPTSHAWEPLGEYGRGLNWYTSTMIGGAPGVQTMSPRGWAMPASEWKTGRYALDRLKHIPNLRFRIAFGASPFASNSTVEYEGFAFDNFKILERDKNVLLFHFAESDESVDRIVYNHVYGELNYPYDVNLMQVHYLDHDPMYQLNSQYINSIRNFYMPANSNALNADGIYYEMVNSTTGSIPSSYNSRDINVSHYEERILQTPHFFIEIDPIQISTLQGNRYSYTYRVEMNPDNPLPAGEKFYIHSALLEDSVYSGNNGGNAKMSVLRFKKPHDYLHDNPSASFSNFTQTIQVPSGVRFSSNADTSKLKVVVWVQRYSENGEENRYRLAKEVYQSASNKAVPVIPGVGGIVGTEDIPTQAQTIIDAKLYPNPAYDRFTVELDRAMDADCKWTLIDMRGVVLQQGKLAAGETQMTVDTGDYPAGMYSLRIDHPYFYIYKKVVLLRP